MALQTLTFVTSTGGGHQADKSRNGALCAAECRSIFCARGDQRSPYSGRVPYAKVKLFFCGSSSHDALCIDALFLYPALTRAPEQAPLSPLLPSFCHHLGRATFLALATSGERSAVNAARNTCASYRRYCLTNPTRPMFPRRLDHIIRG